MAGLNYSKFKEGKDTKGDLPIHIPVKQEYELLYNQCKGYLDRLNALGPNTTSVVEFIDCCNKIDKIAINSISCCNNQQLGTIVDMHEQKTILLEKFFKARHQI